MTNPADRDPVLMAVVEALWDEMGMIADDATCMGMLYAALLSERHRAEEAKWLPIDSAPKDGTQLILARFQWLWDTGDAETGSALWRARIFGGEGATRKYHRCWVTGGFWSSKWNNWNDGIEPSGLSNPTHFLPMPVDALPLTPEPTHER